MTIENRKSDMDEPMLLDSALAVTRIHLGDCQ
jgi:hypothetical protein